MDWKQLGLVLLVGQLFAICVSTNGSVLQFSIIFSKILEHAHLRTPVFNSFLIYCALCLYFCSKHSRGTPIPKWLYALSSIFDVTGLVFAFLAFQRTLIASVILISVLAIVSTSILSILFLNVTYFWNHYVGMLLCTAGVVITVITDLKDKSGKFSLGDALGDIFAVISALSYGATSVISDYILRNKGNNYSVTAHLGFFGSIYTLILFFCFQEFSVFSNFSSFSDSNSLNVLWYPCSAAAGFLFYTCAIILIKISTATVFHLVVLCATLYGAVFDSLLFHTSFVSLPSSQKFWYVIGFLVILAGILLYYYRDSKDSKFENSSQQEDQEAFLSGEKPKEHSNQI